MGTFSTIRFRMALSVTAISLVMPAFAQDMAMPGMTATQPNPPAKQGQTDMGGMDMQGMDMAMPPMTMTGAFGPYAMSREASGTRVC